MAIAQRTSRPRIYRWIAPLSKGITPAISKIEQGPSNSAGEVALGVVDGTAKLALSVGKSLLLNALTLGMYSGYGNARALWNGYQEGGVVGAINPLYQLARGGADAYLAAEEDDYRAAAAAATPVALAAVGAVFAGVLGREALAAEGAEAGAAAQLARGAGAVVPRSVGAAESAFSVHRKAAGTADSFGGPSA